jgi:hypothetical protein
MELQSEGRLEPIADRTRKPYLSYRRVNGNQYLFILTTESVLFRRVGDRNVLKSDSKSSGYVRVDVNCERVRRARTVVSAEDQASRYLCVALWRTCLVAIRQTGYMSIALESF